MSMKNNKVQYYGFNDYDYEIVDFDGVHTENLLDICVLLEPGILVYF